jgi:hypothetical protein
MELLIAIFVLAAVGAIYLLTSESGTAKTGTNKLSDPEIRQLLVARYKSYVTSGDDHENLPIRLAEEFGVSIRGVVAALSRERIYKDVAGYMSRELEAGIRSVDGFHSSLQFMGCNGMTGIAIDKKQHKICLLKHEIDTIKAQIISYDELLSIELFKGIELRLVVNDDTAPLHDIAFLTMTSKQDDESISAAKLNARHWYATLQVIVKNNNARSSASLNAQAKAVVAVGSRQKSQGKNKKRSVEMSAAGVGENLSKDSDQHTPGQMRSAESGNDAVGLGSSESAIPTDGKECPNCAEIVKTKARQCRFCGHSFAVGSP